VTPPGKSPWRRRPQHTSLLFSSLFSLLFSSSCGCWRRKNSRRNGFRLNRRDRDEGGDDGLWAMEDELGHGYRSL
jgi:hypothetical protein